MQYFKPAIALRALTILFSLLTFCASAQITVNKGDNAIDLSIPREYEIGGITVSGASNFDTEAVILFTGLSIGDRLQIPGDRIAKAIKNLWSQDLFSDIKMRVADVRAGNIVYLNIELTERPRLSRYKFTGIKKSDADNIRETISLRLGTIVNENVIQNTKNKTIKYFTGKGFMLAKVDIVEHPDSLLKNSIWLDIKVDKGSKVKVDNIFVSGNESFKDSKVKKALKKTKEKRWYKIFTSAKYLESEYKNDKYLVVDKYNASGYRNAIIKSDSVVYKPNSNRVDIYLEVSEGNKFYFRNIRWIGNTKYSSELLSDRLGIKRGDVYNKDLLQERLVISQNGTDVSSLYLDDGYLSFQANPVETAVFNDSIDFLIQVNEGKQYRVNNIILKGNTKTNDHVVLREIRTRPGDLFSRSDIIRTQRELAGLGYFNPETMGINPIQNPQEGTVDIEYVVEEKPSDQIELSGGWGAGRVVGTLGLRFTNFSLKNMFNKKAWAPLPSGDGQQLSLRAQSNGIFYQGYSFSFVEPWLGGKKPNSFSVSLSHSVQTNGATKFVNVDGDKVPNPSRQALKISGITVGLGKQLKWPDDYFSLVQSLSYQYYDLNNFGNIFSFSNGYSNNIAYNLSFSRNSVSQPIFPRYGSQQTFTARLTPPYSLFSNKDYATATDQEKFKFVEYHKWKFTSTWYTEIVKNLVLYTKVGFGFLGSYNKEIGPAPFERFYLGGSALTGYSLDGREIIGLRGYDDLSLSPNSGALFISKYTMELRYPLSLNPSATIYTLGFLEAGKSWGQVNEYDPFNVYRSGGIGVRIFLPMFGLLGLDYGWRFDDVPGLSGMARSQFHFTIGMNLGEL